MEKTEKAGPGVAEDIEKHISYRKCNGYCMLLPPWLSKLSKLYIYIYTYCSMTYILTQGHAVDPLILQNDEARVD